MMKKIILKYPIPLFCILNIVLALLLGLTVSFDCIPFQWFPGILAIVLTIFTNDKKDIVWLIRNLTPKKKYNKWYLISFIYPLVISILAYMILSYYTHRCISFPELNQSVAESLLLLLFIIWGSIGEELGWRGFMLPLLHQKYSLIKSSIIVGLFWGIWHMYFFLGLHTFLIYILLTIEFSLVISWIQHKINGNIIAAIISHSTFNICAVLLFQDLFRIESSCSLLLIYSTIVILSFAPSLFIIKILKKGVERA